MKDSMVEDLKNTIVSKNEDPKFIEELFQERDLELEKKEIAEYNKEQGREEGREEGQFSIISTMLKNGITPKKVIEMTGISLEKIKKMGLL